MSIATISTQDAIKGYPFVSLKSLSDGPETNATGIPYLYMTSMDVSGKDVEVGQWNYSQIGFIFVYVFFIFRAIIM